MNLCKRVRNMKEKTTISVLNDVFKNDFKVDVVGEKKADVHFFSEKMGIKPYELVHFVCKVEKLFQIKLTEAELLDEDLYTLAGLSRILDKRADIKIPSS